MLQHLIDLFFPKVCAGCTTILLGSENVICTRCSHEIPFTNDHLNPENDTFKKFYGRVDLEFATSLLYFHKKGIVQELIHNLKYRGQQEIGTVLGNWHAEDLKNINVLKSIDFIIPVPLHAKRLKKRGYNQVITFAEALSRNLNIPINTSVLKKDVFLKTQVNKGIIGRSDMVNQNVFSVTMNENLHNKHFLLLDDVVTTGATLEACARELLKIPRARISIVCVAYAN